MNQNFHTTLTWKKNIGKHTTGSQTTQGGNSILILSGGAMHGMHGMTRVKHLKIYEFVLCVDSNSRHTIACRLYYRDTQKLVCQSSGDKQDHERQPKVEAGDPCDGGRERDDSDRIDDRNIKYGNTHTARSAKGHSTWGVIK
jgi:hypothetical protein